VGYQAPFFWVETVTNSNKTREEAEQEAIRLAQERTALSRFPETWKISVTHLENFFQIEERWVPKGLYRLENGRWVKNRQKS
jgi:hypothetical protein